jgi:tripartite-type tricarboxylate transporter receptor subunit TctC
MKYKVRKFNYGGLKGFPCHCFRCKTGNRLEDGIEADEPLTFKCSFKPAWETYLQRIGATGVHVPYKGSSFALPDLIAGNTLMMFDSVTASLPHINSGKLRPLGIASAERSPLMPTVPTLAQAGLMKFDVENLFAIYVPKGTSPKIINRLETELRRIITNPDLKQRVANQGIFLQFENAGRLAEVTNAEHDKWSKIVNAANIKID